MHVIPQLRLLWQVVRAFGHFGMKLLFLFASKIFSTHTYGYHASKRHTGILGMQHSI